MKIVKSVADLKALALETGASVEIGSQRFNTTGDKLKPGPRKVEAQPAAEPSPPPPAPVPAPAPAPEVHVDLAPVAQAQSQIGTMLAQALMSMPRPAEPVREWEFTINRNPDGTLASIRARAVQ